MEVIPAIDVRRGRCVRLYQGDYSKETVYFEDPVEAAVHWQNLGAKRLHVVDLDGAATGAPANLPTMKAIASRVDVQLQVGGGISTLETARQLMDAGFERVVLGTSAVVVPGFVAESCERLGADSVIVGVDTRGGLVAIRGWNENTTLSALDVLERAIALGVGRFVVTDISRDGTLTEPNFQAIEGLVSRLNVKIIASGGISSTYHLRRLADIGVEGAIIGSALYTGLLDSEEALGVAW